MNAIFKKMNYRDQDQVFVINAPQSFEKDVREMESMTAIKTSLAGTKDVGFFLAFVTRQKEVEEIAKKSNSITKKFFLYWSNDFRSFVKDKI